jgi:branched-subunit amino acid transport protein
VSAGEAYVALLLLGVAPTAVWRLAGLLLARRIDPEAEILIFVRFVAAALLAAVVAKLLLAPGGALASVPFAVRLGALLAGLAAFAVTRRSVPVGILAAEAVLIAAAALAR